MISSGFYTWTARAERPDPLRGEEKVQLADYMSQIVALAAGGDDGASVEISYGSHSVTLVVRPKATQAMRERALERARSSSTSGLSGLFARVLLFLYGLGGEARQTLIDRLAERYLEEELSAALRSLSLSISQALALSERRGSIRAILG